MLSSLQHLYQSVVEMGKTDDESLQEAKSALQPIRDFMTDLCRVSQDGRIHPHLQSFCKQHGYNYREGGWIPPAMLKLLCRVQ